MDKWQKFASLKNADLDQDFPFGEFSHSGNIIIHGNRVQRILVEKMSQSLLDLDRKNSEINIDKQWVLTCCQDIGGFLKFYYSLLSGLYSNLANLLLWMITSVTTSHNLKKNLFRPIQRIFYGKTCSKFARF